MLGYTKIQIMGNLGGTPEMKFLPSGDPVVNFSVAVNRRYKDREGNQKEATDWFRVCAFNGIGEACAKHLQKGDGIFVEGRLQVRQYDSKQNGKEVSVEIIPSTVRFLGSGRTEGGLFGDLLHGENRPARHVQRIERRHHVHLVQRHRPLLDFGKDVGEARKARVRRVEVRIVEPILVANDLGQRRKCLRLRDHVDVGVGVGLPPFTFDDPPGVAAA